jgi:molybdenum cofactor guanylyltransferase
VEDLSVFVLAGGRSSRMGSDKALLVLGQQNLLQLALKKARALGARPVIVGAEDKYAQYGEVIEDVIPGCGPLSGIHAALCSTQTERNLIVSVDMPLMTTEFLRWLMQVAWASDEMAIVPQAEGRNQPLCAVYRRAAREVVARALQAGEYKVDRLYALLPTRFVAEGEWDEAGFSPNIFRNVNTPQEFEAVASEVTEVPQASTAGPNS